MAILVKVIPIEAKPTFKITPICIPKPSSITEICSRFLDILPVIFFKGLPKISAIAIPIISPIAGKSVVIDNINAAANQNVLYDNSFCIIILFY